MWMVLVAGSLLIPLCIVHAHLGKSFPSRTFPKAFWSSAASRLSPFFQFRAPSSPSAGEVRRAPTAGSRQGEPRALSLQGRALDGRGLGHPRGWEQPGWLGREPGRALASLWNAASQHPALGLCGAREGRCLLLRDACSVWRACGTPGARGGLGRRLARGPPAGARDCSLPPLQQVALEVVHLRLLS